MMNVKYILLNYSQNNTLSFTIEISLWKCKPLVDGQLSYSDGIIFPFNKKQCKDSKGNTKVFRWILLML